MGIDDFGKGLLVFLVIVLFSGMLVYRYGIANEAAIFGVIFSVILFLDNLGILPNPLNTTINPIIVITAILLISFIIKEETT